MRFESTLYTVSERKKGTNGAARNVRLLLFEMGACVEQSRFGVDRGGAWLPRLAVNHTGSGTPPPNTARLKPELLKCASLSTRPSEQVVQATAVISSA